MVGYHDLLRRVRAEIDEVDPASASDVMSGSGAPLVIDVRERDEWDEGHLPGAVHAPRG